MDLTFLSKQKQKQNDHQSNTTDQHTLLGIVDAGSRACLALQHTPTKASISILRYLLDCIERYGKPKAIRTDNEICFNSALFNAALWLLGIQHQTTQVCCPWQNGRIERFFGTFKRYAKQVH